MVVEELALEDNIPLLLLLVLHEGPRVEPNVRPTIRLKEWSRSMLTRLSGLTKLTRVQVPQAE